MKKHLITLNINGEDVSLAVKPSDTLLDVLRETLDLTGTKHGCDVGDCGACTVNVDGALRLSCLTLAMDMEGYKISTIEGVAKSGVPHPLQIAFDELGAAQCGYCTPGFIMSGIALLDKKLEEKKAPSRQEIETALSGNICRCTGYVKIIEAVELAAKRLLYKDDNSKEDNLL